VPLCNAPYADVEYEYDPESESPRSVAVKGTSLVYFIMPEILSSEIDPSIVPLPELAPPSQCSPPVTELLPEWAQFAPSMLAQKQVRQLFLAPFLQMVHTRQLQYRS